MSQFATACMRPDDVLYSDMMTAKEGHHDLASIPRRGAARSPVGSPDRLPGAPRAVHSPARPSPLQERPMTRPITAIDVADAARPCLNPASILWPRWPEERAAQQTRKSRERERPIVILNPKD